MQSRVKDGSGLTKQQTPTAPFVHESSVVDAGAVIGAGTRIWHFCHVMSGAQIGHDCSFGQNCFVGADVRIGDRVKVQNNVSVYTGVDIEDDVFLGPSMVFTNIVNPRASVSRRGDYRRTRVCRGATIGANATVLPEVTLHEYCFVAAGSVVRHDVAAYALVAGVPAQQIGWVSRHGERLEFDRVGRATCPATGEHYLLGARGVQFAGEAP